MSRSGRLDGGARVAPGPEAEGDAGADHGDADEAQGADGELGDVLAALEGDEGGGNGEQPEAGRETAGEVQAVQHRERIIQVLGGRCQVAARGMKYKSRYEVGGKRCCWRDVEIPRLPPRRRSAPPRGLGMTYFGGQTS
ncbi:MAG: hypothetical protein E6I02_05055 [Chloroflexi bacterium]|nr:MAG: hypothetical protein E6I02_05055 [Chloroflexota bacterium]